MELIVNLNLIPSWLPYQYSDYVIKVDPKLTPTWVNGQKYIEGSLKHHGQWENEVIGHQSFG